eukprot:6186548-Pleurochrysis_carterae.AAC.1
MPSGRRKGPEKRSRTSGRLVVTGVEGGHGDRRAGGRRGGFPRKDVFVGIDLGSEHDARHAGYVHVVCSGRG